MPVLCYLAKTVIDLGFISSNSLCYLISCLNFMHCHDFFFRNFCLMLQPGMGSNTFSQIQIQIQILLSIFIQIQIKILCSWDHSNTNTNTFIQIQIQILKYFLQILKYFSYVTNTFRILQTLFTYYKYL